MTDLELLITHPQAKWVWHFGAFTTVINGYGFGVYRDGDSMRLAGLTQKVVREQAACHGDRHPKVTAFWRDYHGNYTDRMFDIPATPELLSAVVLSACPEIYEIGEE